jgi:hypothetical protein
MSFRDKIIRNLTNMRLPIKNLDGEIIAYLELIGEKDLDNFELIDKITRWRASFKECFLTEFEPTFQRTKSWLEKAIVLNPNRLLFKIFRTNDVLVGHIGAIFRETFVEYDYFILGIKVEIRNFALIVAQTFLLWILDVVNVGYILGNVRSDNLHAINFHLRTGFRIHQKVPMERIEMPNNEINFKETNDEGNCFLHLIEIRATKLELDVKRLSCL